MCSLTKLIILKRLKNHIVTLAVFMKGWVCFKEFCINWCLLSVLLNALFVSVFLTVGIYSIWFYDKKDCQRIAQLMVK